MNFVLPPQTTPSVAVAGTTDRFPVRRIFCVGRNYAAHAREMGADPDREPPFFFTKPADAVVDAGETVAYPPDTENLHHEAELVVAIGAQGRNIEEHNALDWVWGYAIGNDLTRRDLQAKAKEKGRPWDWGKAFDQSAVVGPVHAVADTGHLTDGRIWLTLDGVTKQDGNLNELIWSIPEVISIISRSMTLQAGDLIMTGTPAGVGPVEVGQTCVIGIEGLGEIRSEFGPSV